MVQAEYCHLDQGKYVSQIPVDLGGLDGVRDDVARDAGDELGVVAGQQELVVLLGEPAFGEVELKEHTRVGLLCFIAIHWSFFKR